MAYFGEGTAVCFKAVYAGYNESEGLVDVEYPDGDQAWVKKT